MSQIITHLCWMPLVAGAVLPKTAIGLSAGLAARDDDRTIITDPDTGRSFVYGDKSTDRTVYNAVALFCTILLSVLLGFRLKTLRNNVFRKRNFTSMLVVALFIFGLGFIISCSVVQTGQGLRTHELCYASRVICVVFYACNKLSIYIFLLERARVVRAPFVPRQKDRVWLLGMFIICGGFGSIAVIGFKMPVAEISKIDGRCRIGLPPQVSFPLLCFDIVVNFLLTGVFFWLLRPVLDFHGLLKMSPWLGEKFTSKINRSIRKRNAQVATALEGVSIKSAMNKNIKILLWKCLIGSTLVMIPTVANMTQFYIVKSNELGWVCLTICTFDVSWGVLVVNWLTMGSAEAESNLTSLMSQRTIRADASKPDPTSSFDIGMTTHSEEPSQEMMMRTRQASATTAEVPVFFKAASLKDEGGLLKSDGVRESWNSETGQLPGEQIWEAGTSRAPRLKKPERTWGENFSGGTEACKMWVTVNDRVVRGRESEESLGPRRF